MKRNWLIVPTLLITTTGTPVLAQGSAQNLANSGYHSGQSVVLGAKGATQTLSGLSAIPLKVLESAGTLSGAAGDRLATYAKGTNDEALEISEEVVSVGPAPDIAIEH